MRFIYVVDTETTTTEWHSEKYNGDPDGHIVEIGIVLLDLETGRTWVIAHRGFNDPDATGEEWVYKNTDLPMRESFRMSWEEADEDLCDHIRTVGKRDNGFICITAFNSSFDRTMIERDLPNFSKHLFWCMDIMMSADRIEDIPRKKHDTITGWRSYPSVQATWDYLFPDDPQTEKHRALDDAIQEAKICYELRKRGLYELPYDGVDVL